MTLARLALREDEVTESTAAEALSRFRALPAAAAKDALSAMLTRIGDARLFELTEQFSSRTVPHLERGAGAGRARCHHWRACPLALANERGAVRR